MTCNCFNLSFGAAGFPQAEEPPGTKWRLHIRRLVCVTWVNVQYSPLFLHVTDLGFGVNILDQVFTSTDLGYPKENTQQYFAHVNKRMGVILALEHWAVESFQNLYFAYTLGRHKI